MNCRFLTASGGILLAMVIASHGLAINLDIGGLLSAAKKMTKLTQHDDPAQEELIGQQAALTILSGAPLVNAPEIQTYVNRVGHWIALQSERPDLEWRFGVVNSRAANAWAAPGGYVFITSGMLANMQSEAELAGVLAHEITHVTQKHHLKAVQKSLRNELLVDIASMARDSTGSDSRTAQMSYDPRIQQLNKSLGNLYDKGLSRDDEYEADRLGVALAARAGYDPFGLAVVLQTLGSHKADDSTLKAMLKTHPSTNDRLKKLEPVLEELSETAEGQTLDERFASIVGAP